MDLRKSYVPQGLSLALCLYRHGISCTVYEARQFEDEHGHAIVLSSNGLRVLDGIGPELYNHLKEQGFGFDETSLLNETSEEVGHWPFGGAKYSGYPAIRIARRHVLKELLQLCHQHSIPIIYGKHFSHVKARAPLLVEFAFKDGSIGTSSILVGADGIHSNVRSYVCPNVHQQYIIAAIDFCTPATAFPSPREMPISMTTKKGAFLAAPLDARGEELVCFRIFPIAEPDGDEKAKKEEWKRLQADKDWILSMLRRDLEELPNKWQSAIESSRKESVGLWPFHIMPKLESWTSLKEGKVGERSGVVLIGDAAHTLPPSGAQGANQSFEDAYTLASVLSQVSDKTSLRTALEFWQSWRLKRVEQIGMMSMQMNIMRLPPEEQQQLIKEGKWDKNWERKVSGDFFQWLYAPNLDEELQKWVDDQHKLCHEV